MSNMPSERFGRLRPIIVFAICFAALLVAGWLLIDSGHDSRRETDHSAKSLGASLSAESEIPRRVADELNRFATRMVQIDAWLHRDTVDSSTESEQDRQSDRRQEESDRRLLAKELAKLTVSSPPRQVDSAADHLDRLAHNNWSEKQTSDLSRYFQLLHDDEVARREIDHLPIGSGMIGSTDRQDENEVKQLLSEAIESILIDAEERLRQQQATKSRSVAIAELSSEAANWLAITEKQKRLIAMAAELKYLDQTAANLIHSSQPNEEWLREVKARLSESAKRSRGITMAIAPLYDGLREHVTQRLQQLGKPTQPEQTWRSLQELTTEVLALYAATETAAELIPEEFSNTSEQKIRLRVTPAHSFNDTALAGIHIEPNVVIHRDDVSKNILIERIGHARVELLIPDTNSSPSTPVEQSPVDSADKNPKAPYWESHAIPGITLDTCRYRLNAAGQSGHRVIGSDLRVDLSAARWGIDTLLLREFFKKYGLPEYCRVAGARIALETNHLLIETEFTISGLGDLTTPIRIDLSKWSNTSIARSELGLLGKQSLDVIVGRLDKAAKTGAIGTADHIPFLNQLFDAKRATVVAMRCGIGQQDEIIVDLLWPSTGGSKSPNQGLIPLSVRAVMTPEGRPIVVSSDFPCGLIRESEALLRVQPTSEDSTTIWPGSFDRTKYSETLRDVDQLAGSIASWAATKADVLLLTNSAESSRTVDQKSARSAAFETRLRSRLIPKLRDVFLGLKWDDSARSSFEIEAARQAIQKLQSHPEAKPEPVIHTILQLNTPVSEAVFDSLLEIEAGGEAERWLKQLGRLINQDAALKAALDKPPADAAVLLADGLASRISTRISDSGFLLELSSKSKDSPLGPSDESEETKKRKIVAEFANLRIARPSDESEKTEQRKQHVSKLKTPMSDPEKTALKASLSKELKVALAGLPFAAHPEGDDMLRNVSLEHVSQVRRAIRQVMLESFATKLAADVDKTDVVKIKKLSQLPVVLAAVRDLLSNLFPFQGQPVAVADGGVSPPNIDASNLLRKAIIATWKGKAEVLQSQLLPANGAWRSELAKSLATLNPPPAIPDDVVTVLRSHAIRVALRHPLWPPSQSQWLEGREALSGAIVRGTRQPLVQVESTPGPQPELEPDVFANFSKRLQRQVRLISSREPAEEEQYFKQVCAAGRAAIDLRASLPSIDTDRPESTGPLRHLIVEPSVVVDSQAGSVVGLKVQLRVQGRFALDVRGIDPNSEVGRLVKDISEVDRFSDDAPQQLEKLSGRVATFNQQWKNARDLAQKKVDEAFEPLIQKHLAVAFPNWKQEHSRVATEWQQAQVSLLGHWSGLNAELATTAKRLERLNQLFAAIDGRKLIDAPKSAAGDLAWLRSKVGDVDEMKAFFAAMPNGTDSPAKRLEDALGKSDFSKRRDALQEFVNALPSPPFTALKQASEWLNTARVGLETNRPDLTVSLPTDLEQYLATNKTILSVLFKTEAETLRTKRTETETAWKALQDAVPNVTVEQAVAWLEWQNERVQKSQIPQVFLTVDQSTKQVVAKWSEISQPITEAGIAIEEFAKDIDEKIKSEGVALTKQLQDVQKKLASIVRVDERLLSSLPREILGISCEWRLESNRLDCDLKLESKTVTIKGLFAIASQNGRFEIQFDPRVDRTDADAALATLRPVIERQLNRLGAGATIIEGPRIEGDRLILLVRVQPDGFPFALVARVELGMSGLAIRVQDWEHQIRKLVIDELKSRANDLLTKQDLSSLGLGPLEVVNNDTQKPQLEGDDFESLRLLLPVNLKIVGELRIPFTVVIAARKGISVDLDANAVLGGLGPIVNSELGDSLPLGLKLENPAFDLRQGLRLFVRFNVDVPVLGAGLGGRLIVSLKGVEFGDALRLTIPGWYDAPPVSFGELGATLDLKRQVVGITTSVSLSPGLASSQLLKIRGTGEISLRDGEIRLEGHVLLGGMLSLGESHVLFRPKTGTFEIDSRFGLANFFRLDGHIFVEAKTPRPVGQRMANIYFSSDLTVLGMSFQHFEAGMNWDLELWGNAQVNLLAGYWNAEIKFDKGLSRPSLSFEADLGLHEKLLNVHAKVRVNSREVLVDARAAVGPSVRVRLQLPGLDDLSVESILAALLDCFGKVNLSGGVSTDWGFGNLGSYRGPEAPDGIREGDPDPNGRDAVQTRETPKPIPFGDLASWQSAYEVIHWKEPYCCGINIVGWCWKTCNRPRVRFDTAGQLRRIFGPSGDTLENDKAWFKTVGEWIQTIDRHGNLRLYGPEGATPVWTGKSNGHDGTNATLAADPVSVVGNIAVFVHLEGNQKRRVVAVRENGRLPVQLTDDGIKSDANLKDLSATALGENHKRCDELKIADLVAHRDELGVAACLAFQKFETNALVKVADGVLYVDARAGMASMQFLYLASDTGKTAVAIHSADGNAPGDSTTVVKAVQPHAANLRSLPVGVGKPFGIHGRYLTNWSQALILGGDDQDRSGVTFLLGTSPSPTTKIVEGHWHTVTADGSTSSSVPALDQIVSSSGQMASKLMSALSDARHGGTVDLWVEGNPDAIGNSAHTAVQRWAVSFSNNAGQQIAGFDRSVEIDGNSIRRRSLDELRTHWSQRKAMLPRSHGDSDEFLTDPNGLLEVLARGDWRRTGWRANPYGSLFRLAP